MKKLLITVVVITGFSVSAFTQKTTTENIPGLPIDTVTKKIMYKGVIQQPGITDTLYYRALHWVNTFFKNPIDVTKIRDKENGKVEGIYRFKVYNTPVKDGTKTEAGLVSYTFIIECKENKYRYKITDLNLKGVSYFALERWMDKKDQSYIPEWDYYLTQVDQYIQEFIKNLKKGMLEAVKINDNW
ncbi:MAG: DUF4468 domain-containing protein [Bacteroidales bacterium]